MYAKVEVWTLFAKSDEPDVYLDVHDVHTNQHQFLLTFDNGDHVGVYLPNVRRWKATKKTS